MEVKTNQPPMNAARHSRKRIFTAETLRRREEQNSKPEGAEVAEALRGGWRTVNAGTRSDALRKIIAAREDCAH